jgi:hypothetical protein
LRKPGAWLKWAIETDFELEEAVLRQIREESAQAGAPPTKQDLEDAGQSALFALPAFQGASGSAPDSTDAPERSQAPPAPDPQAVKAWSSLVKDLIKLRGEENLPPWFGDFAGGELRGSTLTVLVPNSTAANYLNDHFGADLVRLWRERAGDEAILQVATDLSSGTRAVLTG